MDWVEEFQTNEHFAVAQAEGQRLVDALEAAIITDDEAAEAAQALGRFVGAALVRAFAFEAGLRVFAKDDPEILGSVAQVLAGNPLVSDRSIP
jgi:hypothetical protein